MPETSKLIKYLKTTIAIIMLLGYGSVINVFAPLLVDGLMLLFTIILMIVNKAYLMNRKIFYALIGIYAVTLFSIIITHSSFSDYTGIYLRSTIATLIITAFKNNYQDITQHIIKAIQIITGLAFINFLLATLFPILFIDVTAPTGYRVYTCGYIFNYLVDSTVLGINFIRNQGIFWEPGILQIPINILLYYILIEQKQPLKKALFPLFVLLTTGSTTGFITFAFILFVKFKSSFSLKGNGLIHSIGMILITAAFIPILLSEIHNKFFSDAGSISFSARTYDILMGTLIITQHPLTGIGINENNYFEATTTAEVVIDGETVSEARGNTNTILSLFLYFGIPIATFLLIALYRQNLFKHKFVFFVIMLLSLMSEPLLVVYFFILLLLSSSKIPIQQYGQKTIGYRTGL